MGIPETRIVTRSISARIIAAGIVIAFCYWASTVLVTLLLAVLAAYFLDPLVTWLERIHIPRALGSLLMVLLSLALIAGLGWNLIERFDQFGRDWPQYRAPLRTAVEAVDSQLRILEMHVSEIAPPTPHVGRVLTVTERSDTLRDVLLGRLSSLYSFLFAVTFLPFLIFFMLAAKRQVWSATMELFPADKRTQAKETLEDVTHVLRSYLAGSVLVALLLVLASWLFFWGIGIDFPFLVALVSGLCNMVPYLGAVMAWIPPLLVGLKQFHSVGPFIGIFAMLTFFHIIAANLLVPALVGWRVRLNAMALTVSLLFWGWLWGAMGLILAIPITAVIKVICDHVEGCRPIGRWLSA
jgi:predicted PurR-regulated permease PerM